MRIGSENLILFYKNARARTFFTKTKLSNASLNLYIGQQQLFRQNILFYKKELCCYNVDIPSPELEIRIHPLTQHAGQHALPEKYLYSLSLSLLLLLRNSICIWHLSRFMQMRQKKVRTKPWAADRKKISWLKVGFVFANFRCGTRRRSKQPRPVADHHHTVVHTDRRRAPPKAVTWVRPQSRSVLSPRLVVKVCRHTYGHATTRFILAVFKGHNTRL